MQHEALDLQLAESLQERAKLVAAFAEEEGLVVPTVPRPQPSSPQEAETLAATEMLKHTPKTEDAPGWARQVPIANQVPNGDAQDDQA